MLGQPAHRSRFAELYGRHRMTSGPSSVPPNATGTRWSAVRSVDRCGGWPGPPAHTQPTRCTWARTASALRLRSAEVYSRGARRAASA